MSDRDDEPEHGDRRRTASVAALALILALVVGGLWLSQKLRKQSALQDCLMSGRSNCARIDPESPPR